MKAPDKRQKRLLAGIAAALVLAAVLLILPRSVPEKGPAGGSAVAVIPEADLADGDGTKTGSYGRGGTISDYWDELGGEDPAPEPAAAGGEAADAVPAAKGSRRPPSMEVDDIFGDYREAAPPKKPAGSSRPATPVPAVPAEDKAPGETADTDPAAFAENVLARQLSVRFIAAGPDLSFGAGGRGSFELLESMAGSLAFETQRVDKVQWDGAPISSTRIRGLVEEARMEEAAEMMGRAYLIRGRVEHGRQLGRTIGIPTANLIPPAEKILPPNGVYYSIVTLDGVTYDAMTNIGVKPTVSDEAKVTAETYLYGFDGDLYGQEASVSLLSFRRPERASGFTSAAGGRKSGPCEALPKVPGKARNCAK